MTEIILITYLTLLRQSNRLKLYLRLKLFWYLANHHCVKVVDTSCVGFVMAMMNWCRQAGQDGHGDGAKKRPTYFPMSYGLQKALKNCILILNLLRKVKEIEKGVWFSFLAIGMSGGIEAVFRLLSAFSGSVVRRRLKWETLLRSKPRKMGNRLFGRDGKGTSLNDVCLHRGGLDQ